MFTKGDGNDSPEIGPFLHKKPLNLFNFQITKYSLRGIKLLGFNAMGRIGKSPFAGFLHTSAVAAGNRVEAGKVA